MVTEYGDPREISRLRKKSAPVRVLVADDEPLIRWSVSETLHDHPNCNCAAKTAGRAATVLKDDSARRTTAGIVNDSWAVC